MANLTDNQKLAAPRRGWSPGSRRNTINGLIFASPWLVGLSAFWIYPILASIYYSFTEFNAIQSPHWVGLANYIELFSKDDRFWTAVYNTFYFAGLSIPLAVITAFGLALLLNAKVKGQVIYRTVYFLPVLVPEVALALVWVYLFTPATGLVNRPFDWIGVKGPCWLTCEAWSRPTLVLLALWIIGQQIVLYLAGLQDVPQDLYDAADVDGAIYCRNSETSPCDHDPVIFFHLITSVIGALQFFTIPYVMTGGTGFPSDSLLLYSILLYKNAFQYFRMATLRPWPGCSLSSP